MGWSEWKKFGGGIELLGTERSYDLSSHTGYQNFTVDNFICECADGNCKSGSQQYSGTWDFASCGYFTAPIKTYDASTGILTITGGTVSSNINRSGSSLLGAITNLTVTTYLVA